MKKILLLGAGRSSSYLIKYLLDNGPSEGFTLTIGDVTEEIAASKSDGKARAIAFDINDEEQRNQEFASADLIISLLPPPLHPIAARTCIEHKKHLITASYVSKDLKALDDEARNAGVIFLNEVGLDPGIDHMSAMKIIEEVREKGGTVESFRSYCGGLIAPESNDNPWGYKFTWNPKNVILAGQGIAQFIHNGKPKFIPYSRLFTDIETITVDGLGSFDAYANRDSISYREPYGLQDISTILRGTLRHRGFCEAWNAFVALGLTDDNIHVENSDDMRWPELIDSFLPAGIAGNSVKARLGRFLNIKEDCEIMGKLEWLGIFNDIPVGMSGSPAAILQSLLEKKWVLKQDDKDMIVMQHQFVASYGTRKERIISSLVVKGEDQVYTSMAKTVGLPAAIAAKLVLNGKISSRGVCIPVIKEIYDPILSELEKFGICFEEKVTSLNEPSLARS